MASFNDCVAGIQKAAGDGTITKDQAESILEKVHDFAAKKKAEGMMDGLDDAVLKYAAGMANEFQIEAVIAKRSEIINIQRKAALRAVMGQYKNQYVALRAILGGVSSLYKGARLSVDARQKAISLTYQKGLLNDMEREGLTPLFNSGTHDREIARELWELTTPGGKPGVSGNENALKMAQIVHKWQRTGVERLNRAGAWVRDLPGYVVRQSHDQNRIHAAGYEQWKADVAPKLDDYTFRNVDDADREKFLKSVWLALSTGEHFKHADGTFDLSQAFGSPGSLAKSASRERVLHFKSAEDWHDYHVKYGKGELREAVYHGLERMGRQLGMLEVLGTNPRNMFDQLRTEALKSVRDAAASGDKGAIGVMADLNSTKLDHIFAELDGTTRSPVNVSIAKVNAGLRAIQSMAKLGGSTLSSIADIASFGAEMRYQGHGFLHSYLSGFQNLIRGRGPAEQREISRLLGIGSESMIGDALSRFNVDDGVPGVMSKAVHEYFRWNLQHWWNDSFLHGAAVMMSNDLAENAHLQWGQLRPDLQRVLRLYDITEREWHLMQDLVHTASDGAKYVTPDKVQSLDDALVAVYLGKTDASARAISRAKDELATKLTTYFSDRAYHAIPHPGANERAFLLRGTQPGTALGEAIRHLAQFKAFPTAYVSKLYARETVGRVEGGAEHVGFAGFKEGLRNGKGAVWHMAEMIAMTTALGYLSMTAKDFAKGKEPRDPKNRDTWVAAMLQGGGLGIYGDFVFGEFNRMGRSATATLIGPTFGQFDDVMEMYSRFKEGDDVAASAVKWALSNTPGINLFYTRAALDYLILYQMQEKLNPGYLQRMERRAREEQHTQFMVPPSSMISYGGGSNRLTGK